jgi:2,4-dienoyl-CoA reductase-like NADH-dependent reductase (Old Yellow Enzyme family)
MSHLFSPLRLRATTFRNRVWVSPMLQYSATDGLPNTWHLVHLGSLARGGAGLVFTEATAVSPEGRITAEDTGLWSDAQLDAWRPIADFVRSQGAVPGIQLGHSGRKGSDVAPGSGSGYLADRDGGWQPVAPSALPYPGLRPDPRALELDEIPSLVDDFASAARRAVEAGFGAIELHAAHGYLLHQFLSPLTNHRADEYGGPFAHRVRLVLQVVDAVRAAVGDELPLVVRVSATDWVDGGWDTPDTVQLAALLAAHGADLVDVSTGGNVADARIPVGPGYQVPFARAVRAAGIPTGSVGMITEPEQAEEVISSGAADVVLLARAMLREPHWPLRAARELGDTREPAVTWPRQYVQAKQ